jgi:thiol-disulfide isomerase/thioredoxin
MRQTIQAGWLLVFCCVFPGVSAAAQTITDAQAKQIWEAIGSPVMPAKPIMGVASLGNAARKWGIHSPQLLRWKNLGRLAYRQAGEAMWDRYPQGGWRGNWLVATTMNAPDYWTDERHASEDIAAQRDASRWYDADAAKRWSTLYVRLEKEYLESFTGEEVESRRQSWRERLRQGMGFATLRNRSYGPGGLRHYVPANATDAWLAIGTMETPWLPILGASNEDEARALYGDSAQSRWWTFHANRAYRDRGLEFWRRFPADVRRFAWLRATVSQGMRVRYLKPLQVDQMEMEQAKAAFSDAVDSAAELQWETDYLPLFVEFMSSSDVIAEWKSDLRVHQFRNSMIALESRQVSDTDALMWAQRAIELTTSTGGLSESTVEELFGYFFKMSADKPKLQAAVLQAMGNSSRLEVRKAAAERTVLAELRKTPMRLRMPLLSGGEGEVDLEQLRGKVVLVELWTNFCSGCIELMPKLQKAYERYRDKGFTIVSVWTPDPGIHMSLGLTLEQAMERERRDALRHLEKKGVTYMNAINRKDPTIDAVDRFTASLLLDQEGRLVTTNIKGDNLEMHLRRLLKLDPG